MVAAASQQRVPVAAHLEIASGIRRIGTGLSNSYLIEEAGEVTIVDAGAPEYWYDLPGELAAMGRSLADVRALSSRTPWRGGLSEALRHIRLRRARRSATRSGGVRNLCGRSP